MRLDPGTVMQEISNLRVSFPALFNDPEEWTLSLESETSIDELLLQLVRSIDDAEAMIEGTRIRLEELHARKARFENRVRGLRTLILRLMQTAELRKKEIPLATISVKQSVAQVVITDPEAVPHSLCRLTYKPDLAAIKKQLLSSGEPVAGAALVDPGESIVIRVR